MRRDGVLLDGWEAKSNLATLIRNEAGVAVITDIPSAAEHNVPNEPNFNEANVGEEWQ